MALGGDQIERMRAAVEDSFTLDGLRQLLSTGLDDNLSLSLDTVVAVEGRNRRDICHDLVLWALHDARVGLQGLLAAALRANSTNPLLLALQEEWVGITFTAPVCPYPGMRPFTAAEQARFYGRDAEIERAVDRLRRHQFLAVMDHPAAASRRCWRQESCLSWRHRITLPTSAGSRALCDRVRGRSIRWAACSTSLLTH